MNGQRLFDALVAAQPETVNLVIDGQSDLKTLQATDGDLATFSQGLASLTQQLRNSNSDVSALIQNSQAAEVQLNPFLAKDSATIAALVSNLGTDAAATAENQPDLRAVFELLPVVSGRAGVGGRRWPGPRPTRIQHADPVCAYIPGSQMPGPTQAVTTPALTNTCTSTVSGMLARGADSTPTVPGG